MVGKVERYLLERIRDAGAVHITLIDPENVTPRGASFLACEGEAGGSSAVMIGGSTFVSSTRLDNVVKAIKKVSKIPTILFPSNITGISKYADAIWFMSLLNSSDPYFITGAQVLAAPLVKKYGLEAMPLGYLIVGEGGAAGVIGRACPIPFGNPELAVAHALAAEYMGMRFVYLEAGSGVNKPVPAVMVQMVSETVGVPLVVGGGIRTADQAKAIVTAGCDIVVTSTVLEESDKSSVGSKIEEIVEGIKEGVTGR
ncbi:MAG: geranylgeranylglyceryl phosphate synthase [Latescibacteria bacterium DG_63]|nr:MAG: geranylgeranylglyceryl phosphate synthase [Latescibacteria bacterium DG_63]